MEPIISFLTSSWIGNLLGIIGGALGLWTFLDNYLLRFKPKLFIGSKAAFYLENNPVDKDKFSIESIIVSIEVANHRNKYGLIHDLALRVYKANAINPNEAIYFASSKVEYLVSKITLYNKVHNELFSPISVLPKTNRSLNISFSELLYSSSISIDKNDFLNLELYYQKRPKSKWSYVGKYYLYRRHESTDEIKYSLFTYTLIDWHIGRDKIKKIIKPTKSTLYKGSSNKFIKVLIKRLYWRIILRQIYLLRDTLLIIPYFFIVVFDHLYNLLVRIPLLRKRGKHLDKSKVSSGEPEKKPTTQKCFNKIFMILQKEIKKINKGADKNAIIEIKRDGDQIMLTRNDMNFKIYRSGDSHIVAHQKDLTIHSRLHYEIELKESHLGFYYWYQKNYGIVTSNSFAIKVLDSFLLHSCY